MRCKQKLLFQTVLLTRPTHCAHFHAQPILPVLLVWCGVLPSRLPRPRRRRPDLHTPRCSRDSLSIHPSVRRNTSSAVIAMTTEPCRSRSLRGSGSRKPRSTKSHRPKTVSPRRRGSGSLLRHWRQRTADLVTKGDRCAPERLRDFSIFKAVLWREVELLLPTRRQTLEQIRPRVHPTVHLWSVVRELAGGFLQSCNSG